MDFFDAVRVILRRWMIVVPVLMATAVVGILIVSGTPAKFKATGSVAVVGPAESPTQGNEVGVPAQPGNPLSTSDLAAILNDVILSPSSAKELQAMGAQGYTITTPAQSGQSSPLILFSATTTSPAASIKSVQVLMKFAEDQATLRQQQVGAGSRSWSRVVSVTEPTMANRLVGGKVRVLAAFGALGLIVATSAAFLVESAATRRKRESEGTATPPGAEATIAIVGPPDELAPSAVAVNGGQNVPSNRPSVVADPQPTSSPLSVERVTVHSDTGGLRLTTRRGSGPRTPSRRAYKS
jgi:hypothetical protein